MMEPIYLKNHIDTLARRLCSQGQVFRNNPNNDRVAVIIEPRRDPFLLKVIRSTMHHLGIGWNLHVFTSEGNVLWLTERLPACSFRITPLDRENISPTEYSALLMCEAFWNTIPEENVLIFQTDSILFRHGMDTWVGEYDYVGANFYHPQHVSPMLGGIQGGLSLRKKEAMVDCIQRVSHEDVQSYRRVKGMGRLPFSVIPEDIFFTHACEILQKRVPSVEKRREFSIEADYHPKTLGHHGLKCCYLTREQQQELLSDA